MLPKKLALFFLFFQRQTEAERGAMLSLSLFHSQKVRQQIMGAESGLLFPLGHGLFFASWTDVQQVGAQLLYERRWRRWRSPPANPFPFNPQLVPHPRHQDFIFLFFYFFFEESTCETPRNYARQLDNSKLGDTHKNTDIQTAHTRNYTHTCCWRQKKKFRNEPLM